MKEFNDAWGFKQPKELTLHRVPTVTHAVANTVTNAVTNEVAPVDTTQIIIEEDVKEAVKDTKETKETQTTELGSSVGSKRKRVVDDMDTSDSEQEPEPVKKHIEIEESKESCMIETITSRRFDYYDIYQNCTDDNTPYYSYDGVKKQVKVLRVVDGDTVDIAYYHDETQRIYKYRIRLYGIDTPEKRPLKSNPNREKEMAAAKKSSQAMIDKLKENDNIVLALFYKPDKYGRLLATFYDKNGEDINQWMVASGFATSYFGKTKKSYDDVVAERGY
jgi:endonuclease YncB( thermonuclease family)